jgi:hypothetical protein
MELVTVVEKLASLPKAAASSLRVSNAPGAELMTLLIEVSTYNLVAASAFPVCVPNQVILLPPIAIAPDIVPPASGSIVSAYALVAASVDAVGVPNPVILLAPIAIAPDIVPPANGNLVAIELVTVVENAASLPRAVANSLRVSRVAGADATRLDTAVPTKAVVAT